MATQVEHPMLSIDPSKMSQVDPNNAGSLANVWGGKSHAERIAMDEMNLTLRSLSQMLPVVGKRPSIREHELEIAQSKNNSQ